MWFPDVTFWGVNELAFDHFYIIFFARGFWDPNYVMFNLLGHTFSCRYMRIAACHTWNCRPPRHSIRLA